MEIGKAEQSEVIELLKETHEEHESRPIFPAGTKEAILEYDREILGNQRNTHAQASEYLDQLAETSGDFPLYEISTEDVGPESVVRITAESEESYSRGDPDELEGFDTVLDKAVELETGVTVTFYTSEEAVETYQENM